MKVKDIMTARVLSVPPEEKVDAIARIMSEHNISGLPVVDALGRVVGIVTEADLIVRNAQLHFPAFLQILDSRIYLQSPRHFEEELRRILGTTAADIMSAPAISVSADDDVQRAATLMVEKKLNPIPVLENGKLVGIVSRSDLVRLLVQESQA